MDRDDIERRAGRILRASDAEVVVAYLFGSVARGTAGADSDVDIAVLLRADRPRQLSDLPQRLEAELERELAQPVQVVVLNRAPIDLVHRVLRDGRLLLERDRSARIQFEVAARNRYFDLLPTLHRYRQHETAQP